jgi:hypothetical protein
MSAAEVLWTQPAMFDLGPEVGEQLTLEAELEELEAAELCAELDRSTVRLVVVVPCSAAKLPAPTTAELLAGYEFPTAGELYLGTFHRYARQHAERIGADEVLILSAGHGLIPLDRIVAPYDVSITDKDSIVATPGKVAHQAATRGLLDPDVVVVSLCPAAYTAELRKAVPNVVTPLAGSRGIGEQRGRIARLNRAELAR